MSIKKIKFGDQTFDLVAAGVNLADNGGTILKSGGSISQIGLTGEADWKRPDLVYAGRLTKQSDYVIRLEEDGITEVKADVMISTCRTPDLTERVAALEAENAEIKKDNESLKSTVDTLVLSSLEG
ncbi:MAG: hypothetical protein ACK5H4_21380 [Lacrimispora sphenoides]